MCYYYLKTARCIYHFYYLKTARCIYHLEFLSCLSFLTKNSNTIIITAFAQNCVGLDSDLSFGVTVCLRQSHSLVETGKHFSLHKLYIAL